MVFGKAGENLAQRKRQLVQDELSEAALKLLAFQGFEKTTIDEIASAAGVSRRTFFRYFKSKEDVIIEFLGHVGLEIRAGLAARPAPEPPVVALRQAFKAFVTASHVHPDKSLRLTRLILTTPSLTARYLERQREWKSGLAAELSSRLGTAPGDLAAEVITGVAFAALDTAMNEWVASEGKRTLPDLLDETFAIAFPS